MIQREENWYVAKCIENSIASQGTIIKEHQTLITTLELVI